ncbi:MAG: chemotaxis protein CheB, partial [Verrucomicrobiota bacterium]
MSNVIRILIVDDSAFVRKVVKEIVSRSPYLEVVGAARDGKEALQLVEQLQPDVVTCDLLMPGMDGITFVREQMSRKPLPILILTATEGDGEMALQAIEAGAIDIVQKPTALANEKLLGIREELIEKIKAVAQAPALALRPMVQPTKTILPVTRPVVKTKIVVIGISTGGPQALRFLLPRFPANFPVPIAIVLHMPVGYIEIFAAKLNELSSVEVGEVKEGDELQSGKVFVAQAGRHLALRRESETKVVATLPLAPVESLHRPSADV